MELAKIQGLPLYSFEQYADVVKVERMIIWPTYFRNDIVKSFEFNVEARLGEKGTEANASR